MKSSLLHIMMMVALMTPCASAQGEKAELVPRVPQVGGEPVVLSPDGRHLATFWYDRVYLWDTERGLPIRSLECGRPTIEDLPETVKALVRNEVPSFSPDGGRMLIRAVENGTFIRQVVDVAAGFAG